MFHVEMRMGMSVVREFNMSEQGLWTRFLAPLMADRDFTLEGQDFTPRRTRIKIYDGPELRPDQLQIGRGWQSVERIARDVTEPVLARAREHVTAQGSAAGGASAPDEALRQRVIGRLAAGPVSLQEIGAIAGDLMPAETEQERLEAALRAAYALLESGAAQLAPVSGR